MLVLRPRQVVRIILLMSIAVAAWLAASLPFGFSVFQLALFAGPGIVLAIAASWASHAAYPNTWSWQNGLRAAALGAGIFPPFVALFFAWAGTFGSAVAVTLLVVSAWLVLLGGLLLARARVAVTPKHVRPRTMLSIAPRTTPASSMHRRAQLGGPFAEAPSASGQRGHMRIVK